MIEIVILLLSALVSDASADALRRTYAPLDRSVAKQHILAAGWAQKQTGVDSDLLLSIAWHESRYDAQAVGPESGGRVSCGPMTPTPVARCAKQNIVDGYLAGARHLKEWLANTKDRRTALLGYAGGYRMIDACSRGPVLRKGKGDDLCRTPDVFLARAAWIRREMSAARPSA